MTGHHSRSRRAAMAVVALLALTSSAGCDRDAPPPPCPTSPSAPGLAAAVGGHTGGPQASWPAQLADELETVIATARDGRPETGVTLVRVDGRPSVGCVVTLDTSPVNGPAQEQAASVFRSSVAARVGALTAVTPEANPLEALAVAAESAGPGGTVALIDSGLQTVAPLDFRQPDLLGADPEQVADALSRDGHLPDLRDRRVVLAGIGQTTEPQAPLSVGQRENLGLIWEAIAGAAGAVSVERIVEPVGTATLPGLPAVSPVPIPPPDQIELVCDSESVLHDDGPVGFEPGRTTFLDDDGAREVLSGFADWLTATRGSSAVVTGSIAHHGDDDPGGLSLDRAERIRDVLTGLGVDAGRIEAIGAGWGPFPTPTAAPDLESDQLNRRVVVELRCA